mmetsp:Transcript_14044/g.46536  ORF Transcript_14044/g.46536 Transcript_14044/m.46536 type:complete len:349 (+) Transcript_14044:50-1096(+)
MSALASVPVAVTRADSRAGLRASRTSRARVLRASVVTSATATKDAPVVVAGATTSTGRLVASLAVKKYGGANVVLVVNKDAQKTYWPEDMPEDVVEQRMFAPADELVKCVLVDPREAADALGKCSSVIFCAEWGATQAELATALTPLLGSNCGRAVMLSRVGINRRDKAPFETQNKPPKKMQEMALGLKLPFGENSGQPGTLDGFADAEGVLAAAQANSKWTAHVVRSGELRGNGPLLLADLSARLVDNLYDVKYQDLYFRKGDDGQGYTKRLNLAATLLHTTTTTTPAPDVAALSVVCEMVGPFGLLGEKTVTEPTGVERRKGYDMAKGKAPGPIAGELIDELIAEL